MVVGPPSHKKSWYRSTTSRWSLKLIFGGFAVIMSTNEERIEVRESLILYKDDIIDVESAASWVHWRLLKHSSTCTQLMQAHRTRFRAVLVNLNNILELGYMFYTFKMLSAFWIPNREIIWSPLRRLEVVILHQNMVTYLLNYKERHIPQQ